jgi:hypothetical protein
MLASLQQQQQQQQQQRELLTNLHSSRASPQTAHRLMPHQLP